MGKILTYLVCVPYLSELDLRSLWSAHLASEFDPKILVALSSHI